VSFAEIEESRYGGRPVTLYHFRYGTAVHAFYAYTDAEQTQMFDGVPHAPIPIKRSAIQATGSLDKNAMTITTPISTELADLFRIYPPSQMVVLTIRQRHLGDPDEAALLCWTGRILSMERKDSEAIFTCEAINSSMRRTGLRRHYQYGCPHVLYSPGAYQCRADKSKATITKPVVTIPFANQLGLAGGWNGPIAPEKYNGGLVEWDTDIGVEVRTIMRVLDGSTLVLNGAVRDLVPGQDLRISLGCNHQTSDCTQLHNNILNYGGQPYIPLSNPLRTNPYN